MKKIVYAYWVIYEYIKYHKRFKYGFFRHWRNAWNAYHKRPYWYEEARKIHERQKREGWQ